MSEERLAPVKPGDVLYHEYMVPYGISPDALARAIGVQFGVIEKVMAGERQLDADLALRLTRYFGTSAESWLNLEHHYQLELADRENEVYSWIEPFKPATLVCCKACGASKTTADTHPCGECGGTDFWPASEMIAHAKANPIR